MTGLYKDTPGKCVYTAGEFIALGADTVRIYPTVILSGTRLGELYKSGEYKSFGFDETVELCARLRVMFDRAGITVIRTGLHASREVEEKMLGGVYHPALGELVESRIFYNDILESARGLGAKKLVIYTDPANISRIAGQKKENKSRLSELGITYVIKAERGTRLRVESAERNGRHT